MMDQLEKLDDEAIDDLRQLEKEMFMQGDSRSDVLRRVLDLLWIKEIIDDEYEPPKTRSDPVLKKVKSNKNLQGVR
jgi:hypothetical protein